ncbi:hypothetical protein MASR2M64_09330 [Candidatus Cloacimonadota bacterium]
MKPLPCSSKKDTKPIKNLPKLLKTHHKHQGGVEMLRLLQLNEQRILAKQTNLLTGNGLVD